MASNAAGLREVRDYVEHPAPARDRQIRADLQTIQDAYDYHVHMDLLAPLCTGDPTNVPGELSARR
jgi:hypothetical protein